MLVVERLMETIRRFIIVSTGLSEDAVLEFNYAGEDINIFPAVRFALSNIMPISDNCMTGYVDVVVNVYDMGVNTYNVLHIIQEIWNTRQVEVVLSDSTRVSVASFPRSLIPITPIAQGIFHGGLHIRLRVPATIL